MLLLGTGSAVLDAAGSLCSVLCSLAGAALGLDGLGALYAAYARALMRLDDEAWLLQNCRDPLFFSKMRAHTTVCSDVEANARVGAFWAALREVKQGFRISWEPWLGGAFLALVVALPVCWVCAARASGRLSRHRWETLPRHQRVCKEL